MNTIIAIFILSMILSLILTPIMGRIARKYHVVDMPSERKVHQNPIPRIGGAAIGLSFFLPFLSILFYSTSPLERLIDLPQLIYIMAGSMVMFSVGLWDDIRSVSPLKKLFFQIMAALIAYIGGVRITGMVLPGFTNLNLNFLSLPATILWFLLVINAINLIDGLDGLAAGITLFASIVLIVLCVTSNNIIFSLAFSALGGACLGFLRYNFNPASIFMGDCGSYFLGYMMAALSIAGSVKSQATAALLIPVIALGVPLMDTLWAPIRRFLTGRHPFSPDRSHFHHQLIKMGITHRKAVLILYGMSVILGIMAIFLVHTRNRQAALILLLIGVSMFLGIRKLGYFEYIAADKVYGWVKDLTDEAGITLERRSFLSLQMEIASSVNLNQLWNNICEAMERLKFDYAEMQIEEKTFECMSPDIHGGHKTDAQEQKTTWSWSRKGFNDICNDCLLKLELPLLSETNQRLGTLWMIKDLKRDSLSHYTLRRVEHLRRTVIGTLKGLMDLNAEQGLHRTAGFQRGYGTDSVPDNQ